MSLLGGMIAGGLSGGANAAFDMADKTIDHNRKAEVSDLEFKRTTALEQMRTQSAMARDDISHGRNLERDDLAYNRGLEQYELQRGHAVEDRNYAAQQARQLASMRSSGTGTERLDPRVDLLSKDIDRYSKALAAGMLDDNQKILIQQQLNEAIQMRNQLAGLPFGGGLLGGAGDGTGGMDEDTSTSLMAGLQKYLGGKDAANQQATLSDREISARNNITITPKQDRPTLLHQSFVPQSAQANRPKYNVGTDIGTIDDRQFLGLAVQALVDDGYMNMPDEVKSAIIERLPAIRNQLPASLVSRAEELR